MFKDSLVGIWSGASPAKKSDIKNGLKYLKDNSCDYYLSPTTKKIMAQKNSSQRPFLAGTDKERADSLIELIRNPRITDILCTRGGYGNIRILSLLDKVHFKKSPTKRIWGYSDATVIQHYFFKRFRWPWVHSPMLSSESFFQPNKREELVWNKIFSSDECVLNKFRLKLLNKGLKKDQPKKGMTPMIGGNLTSILSLLGTPHELKFNKKFLLFLEDIGENAYKIDRMLTQLEKSAYFKNCIGVCLGHFTRCQGFEKVFKKWAEENKLYLYSGIRAGHESPNLPLSFPALF